MRLLGMPIEDLLPPALLRRLKRKDMGDKHRIHPFDCVPSGLEARWVMDVGANVGDVSVAALESYKGCKVICFEPVSTTFGMLKERMRPYGKRAVLYRKALSDEKGTGEINITTFHGANSILPQSDFHKKANPHVKEMGKESIELVRLDDIAGELPTDWVDIMKIDVEGYEMNVLRGAKDFLSSHVDVVLLEASLMRDRSWEEQSITDMFTFLRDRGFNLVNIYDVCNSGKGDMMLVQMDCVFRHRSRLGKGGCRKDGTHQKG